MIVSERHRQRIREVPAAPTLRKAMYEYMARTDMNYDELAGRIGYGASSLRMFAKDLYSRVADSDGLIREAIWKFLERNPIAPSGRLARDRLFETSNYRRIRDYFLRAVERGEVCLLYGPPGTQKSFVLEHLVAERNLAKKDDALYVYAGPRITQRELMVQLASQAGLFTTKSLKDRIKNALIRKFRAARKPPALVIDEAQHLDIDALEDLRHLNDRSGCGLVLAGSHTLLDNFLRGRAQLEQWISRIDHKDPLPGLLKEEVVQIAARELGNGRPARLSDSQLRALLRACETEDIFARDPSGKSAPRTYLSVRRLVKNLAQYKEAQKTKEAAA